MIVTDFLPILSNLCLPVCIEVVGRYGLQDQDLNISLSSIGLLVIYRTAGNIGENLVWRLAYKSSLAIFTLTISVLHPSVLFGHAQFDVKPPNKGLFGTNINVLSSVERLSSSRRFKMY